MTHDDRSPPFHTAPDTSASRSSTPYRAVLTRVDRLAAALRTDLACDDLDPAIRNECDRQLRVIRDATARADRALSDPDEEHSTDPGHSTDPDHSTESRDATTSQPLIPMILSSGPAGTTVLGPDPDAFARLETDER